MEAPGIESSEGEQGDAEFRGVSGEETGTSVAAVPEANGASMGFVVSPCSSEVAGDPGHAGGSTHGPASETPPPPRAAIVAELGAAAVAAFAADAFVTARAAARALVEFIDVVAGHRRPL